MSVISYKCPNCDGELVFDPKSQKYKCAYCMSIFTEEDLPVFSEADETTDTSDNTGQQGQSTTEESAQQESGDDTNGAVYSCPSCGAEIITDDTTAASFCYYCHNPVVFSQRLAGEYRPDKIIPFQIDRKDAETKFLKEAGSRYFVPAAFFQKKQIEKISGVYFPYWIYDASLEGSLTANATRTRIWIVGDDEFTETSFFNVHRDGEVSLSDMYDSALRKANLKLAEGVFPFELEAGKSFSMSYLSGYFAEKRDIEIAEVGNKMQEEAKEYAQSLLRDTISGYETVTQEYAQFQVKEESFSYMLLPVWTLTYKGKNGKQYYYSMNGQTGKLFGELPLDWFKLTMVSAITAVAVMAAALAGGFFLW